MRLNVCGRSQRSDNWALEGCETTFQLVKLALGLAEIQSGTRAIDGAIMHLFKSYPLPPSLVFTPIPAK